MKKLFILLLLLVPLKAIAETHSHSLWLMVTLIKGDTPFPEFSGVALLDDILFGYYDTNNNKLLYRGINNSDTQLDTSQINYISHLTPDTSDINYIGNFIGYYIHGPMTTRADYLRNHLNHTNMKPRVRLLQKQGPGSTVTLTCLATGFYPRHINLTLLRDGQPVPDHQITGGELLPNGDETYQMRKSLEVSAKELQQHHYTCTAQHLSLDNKLEANLDHKWDSVTTSIVSSVLVAAFVCLFGGVLVFFICRRKHNGATATSEAAEVSYSPASSTEDMDKGITSGKAGLEKETKD